MTVKALELNLSLTTNDVQDLWTTIEYTVYLDYWTSTSKGSQIYIEALRHVSYGLIVRIINH